MAVRILKDSLNNTIDIDNANLANFTTTVINPINAKLTRISYNDGTNTTNIAGNFTVEGHTGTVLFTGDVESTNKPASTNPPQSKVVNDTFVKKTFTISGLALSSNISASSLAEATFTVTSGTWDDPDE